MMPLKLKRRPLGATGITVSEISFGAGPVSGLMTGNERELQRKTVQRALEAGVNWFDTAAGYGEGRSETNLGAVLRELGASEAVHLATKVRLAADQLNDIKSAVRTSVAASLKRLGVPRVTLLQLHNSITPCRGDQATSITPRDVLGENGVLEAFHALRSDGLVAQFGLTGLGDDRALREVIGAGSWSAIQACVSLVAPRREGDLISFCAQSGMGVIGIRALAGGALAGQAASAHTHTTKFFPLDIYRGDQQKAARLEMLLPSNISLKEAALRYVLGDPDISTALVGFANPEQIDEAADFAQAGPLEDALRSTLTAEAGAP
jgi:aryl-alcohol dehydrogenase-like predicted oxidoreductase